MTKTPKDMKQVNVHTAKTHLSRLVAEACRGEEVVIARGNTPLVRLAPLEAPRRGRRFGALKGRARLDEGFFEPLPEEELQAWEET